MSDKTQTVRLRVPLFGFEAAIVTLVLIGMKASVFPEMSWFLVFLPMYFALAAIAIVYAIIGFLMFLYLLGALLFFIGIALGDWWTSRKGGRK